MVDLCFPLFLELGVLDFVMQAQTTGFSSPPSWPHQCPKSQKAENLNQPHNTSSYLQSDACYALLSLDLQVIALPEKISCDLYFMKQEIKQACL